MTTEYRNSIATSSKKNLERLRINFFPAFCPAAILYNGKSRENVMGLTDLCFIEIDHIKTEKKVDMAMSILRDDRNVLLASRSVSGNGIHILVRYRMKDEDVAPQIDTMSPKKMQKQYRWVFDILGRQYQEMLQLKMVSDDMDLRFDPQGNFIEEVD